MGFWGWFAVWTALILLAAGFLIYLLAELAKKGMKLAKELEKLEPAINALEASLAEKTEAERPEPDLLKDPVEVYRRRRAVEKRREQKREARKHMLIKRLSSFDPAESRFK